MAEKVKETLIYSSELAMQVVELAQ